MKNINNSIALFGTSADPPTNGHQKLLLELAKIFPKVITWASNNPLKTHGTNLENRHKLLKKLVFDLKTEKIQIFQDLSSPLAVNTLKKANNLWPQSNFIFIIGSDLIEQIYSWVNINEVLKLAEIGIAPRKGWPLKTVQLEKIQKIGGRIKVLPLEIPETSSSSVRAKLSKSQIPSNILELLLEQNLYGMTDN